MARKSKKPLTAAERLELELQLESELSRLQKTYQIMAAARNLGGPASKLAKQQKVIKILKKEQRDVQTDLQIATSDSKKKEDAQVSEKLTDLLSEHDEFDAQIGEEKTQLKEIDYQINKIEKQVIVMRSKQITDAQYQRRVAAGQRAVEGLENKLNTTVTKFCMLLTENQKLREEIDHLLKERTDFNKMWEKLVSNLNQGKKFMLDLIEQATIAYDQREEWCSRLQALRIRAHSDLIVHTQEMRELQGRIDHDSKLQDFLNIKNQKRIMRDLEHKKMRKRQSQKAGLERLLSSYQEILYNIKVFTGEADINLLAKHFLRQEEDNFSLFNYINELNAELEYLSDNLARNQASIDEQRAINEARASQQTSTLSNLTAELKRVTLEANKAQKDAKKTEDTLQNLYKGITKLFQTAKCSNAPFLELLGNNTTINHYNVLLYLQVLEKRVSELIINVYYKEKTVKVAKGKVKQDSIIKEDKVKHRLNLVDKFAPSQPCPLCVEQEQVSDVIDALQFALNKDEIKEKLRQRLLLPDGLERIHNVSACHLPKSRQIIQKRYQ